MMRLPVTIEIWLYGYPKTHFFYPDCAVYGWQWCKSENGGGGMPPPKMLKAFLIMGSLEYVAMGNLKRVSVAT